MTKNYAGTSKETQSRRNKFHQTKFEKSIDKIVSCVYNILCSRGCGGIGIRARLRGVFRKEYEFKSRQPH